MGVDSRHFCRVRARCGAVLLFLGALGCSPLAPSALAASSQYPASATRPALRINPAELAYPARRSPSKPSAQRRKKPPAHPRSKRQKPRLPSDAVRALAAYEEMQRQYYVERSGGLYAGEPFAYLWPFSQALAATVSMAYIPGIPDPGPGVSFGQEIHERLLGLSSYLDTDNSHQPEGTFTSTLAAYDGEVAPPAGPGGPKYYDDNDWVGIELVRLFKLTHDASLLGSAEGIMAFEMAAWESGPDLACPGGIPFSNEVVNDTRNTVTNAPTAELGVELYELTGDAEYLAFAQMAYEWVRRCLLLPSGLYADHINSRGTINASLWSYNQGTMIGAGTLLYQATGDGAYLWQARQTARAALSYYTLERLNGELPFFVSVYLRNLLYLDSVTHDPPGPRLARAYVNNAWQKLRLSSNLFVWGSPPSAQLLVQAAIVQIYALLCSPPSTYF
jgi:Glycosyl hydrolase family 76